MNAQQSVRSVNISLHDKVIIFMQELEQLQYEYGYFFTTTVLSGEQAL